MSFLFVRNFSSHACFPKFLLKTKLAGERGEHYPRKSEKFFAFIDLWIKF